MKQVLLLIALVIGGAVLCPTVNAQEDFADFVAVGPLSTECPCVAGGPCTCENCKCAECSCVNCPGKVQAVEESRVVLVTATAWCQPCVNFEPVWKEVVGQYDDVRFEVVDLSNWEGNVKDHPLCKAWGVASIPTVLELKGDKVVVRYRPGPMNAGELRGVVRESRN